MRDPSINLSSRLEELEARWEREKDPKLKQQLSSEIREINRRLDNIQRMIAHGVKFRRIL